MTQKDSISHKVRDDETRRHNFVGVCVRRRPNFVGASKNGAGGASSDIDRQTVRRARSSESNALRLILELRRDAIGERVGMKIGVITQTGPRAVLLGGLRYRGFLTRGKVVPRIVTGDS
jgi:hypothetical protein